MSFVRMTDESHDALSAMPGDQISFNDLNGTNTGIVRSAGWQPTPKGGKVWTYELEDGSLVPNTNVIKVTRGVLKKNSVETLDEITGKAHLLKAVELADISSTIKTAIFCIVRGDVENMEVGRFLIDQRIRELKELTNSQ